MPYEGELLNACPVGMFDFNRAYAVVVSGAKFNPYGHMLLNTGGRGGKYFHVSDVVGAPRAMSEHQFQRYLRENNKTIVTVMRVPVPNPRAAHVALEEALSKKWVWMAVVNNCETMVEEILMAGGGRKLRVGAFPLPMHSTNQCEGW